METSVKIGARVFGIIILFMLLYPIIMGAWSVFNALEVYINSDTDEAKIYRCERRTITSWRVKHKARSLNRGVAYYHVAITQDRIEVFSTFGTKNRKDCEAYIGKKVPVYVYHDKIEKSLINTFVQFWAFPVGGALVCLIFLFMFWRLLIILIKL